MGNSTSARTKSIAVKRPALKKAIKDDEESSELSMAALGLEESPDPTFGVAGDEVLPISPSAGKQKLNRRSSAFAVLEGALSGPSGLPNPWEIHETTGDIWLLFKPTKVLGSGSYGKVVSASDRRTGYTYALKMVPITHETSFKREIDILRTLIEAPNIVNYYGAYKDRKHFTMLLEECSGGDLFEHTMNSSGPTRERAVCLVARQLLQAVYQCHCWNVAHRDIKPENFVLSPLLDAAAPPPIFGELSEKIKEKRSKAYRKRSSSGTLSVRRLTLDDPEWTTTMLKLTDFGMAVSLNTEGEEDFKFDINSRGYGFGTLYYVAPELFKSLETSTPLSADELLAADIWAAGATIYFTATQGFHAFYGPKEGEEKGEDYVRKRHEVETKRAIMKASPRKPYWISDLFWDFLSQFFILDTTKRITASKALKHPWIQGESVKDHNFPLYYMTGIINIQEVPELLVLIAIQVARTFKDADLWMGKQWITSISLLPNIQAEFEPFYTEEWTQEDSYDYWTAEASGVVFKHLANQLRTFYLKQAAALETADSRKIHDMIMNWDVRFRKRVASDCIGVRHVSAILILGQYLCDGKALNKVLSSMSADSASLSLKEIRKFFVDDWVVSEEELYGFLTKLDPSIDTSNFSITWLENALRPSKRRSSVLAS